MEGGKDDSHRFTQSRCSSPRSPGRGRKTSGINQSRRQTNTCNIQLQPDQDLAGQGDVKEMCQEKGPRRFLPSAEMLDCPRCTRCSLKVFFGEAKQLDGRYWHSYCFTCANVKCKRPLSMRLTNFSKGDLYCDHCYSKWFGPDGFRDNQETAKGFRTSLDNPEWSKTSWVQAWLYPAFDPNASIDYLYTFDLEMCKKCCNYVHITDQFRIRNLVWHRRCFCCDLCSTRISSPSNSLLLNNSLYCKRCHRHLCNTAITYSHQKVLDNRLKEMEYAKVEEVSKTSTGGKSVKNACCCEKDVCCRSNTCRKNTEMISESKVSGGSKGPIVPEDLLCKCCLSRIKLCLEEEEKYERPLGYAGYTCATLCAGKVEKHLRKTLKMAAPSSIGGTRTRSDSSPGNKSPYRNRSTLQYPAGTKSPSRQSTDRTGLSQSKASEAPLSVPKTKLPRRGQSASEKTTHQDDDEEYDTCQVVRKINFKEFCTFEEASKNC